VRERFEERLSRRGQRGPDGSDAHAAGLGDVRVLEIGEVPQEDEQALPGRKLPYGQRELGTRRRLRERRIQERDVQIGVERQTPAVLVAQGEAEGDPPDPTGQASFPPEAISLLDRLNECLLKDVVGGLLISRDGRQRVPEAEVLLAVQAFELSERGSHATKSPRGRRFLSLCETLT
jgi:hypothetical protein